ncbi:hypothetical protein ABFA07_017957 [Porites harrisoni]
MQDITPEPENNFVEIVKVGRRYHYFPDVTIYYRSEDKKFKVEGGCKVKEYEQANQGYRQIKVVMDDEHRIFEIRRSKRGEYLMVTDGYWITHQGQCRV